MRGGGSITTSDIIRMQGNAVKVTISKVGTNIPWEIQQR